MTEADLLEMVRASSAQIAALYAQLISITFAMVVAIYYFLNRARMTMKLLSFAIYLVGALMFIGLMLEESNLKRVALNSLAALPEPSPATAGLLALQSGWLFQARRFSETWASGRCSRRSRSCCSFGDVPRTNPFPAARDLL